MLLELLLLTAIGGFSVGMLFYIYKRFDDEDGAKKSIYILLTVMIILSTVFVVFEVHTRDIAMGVEGQNQTTLQILLGIIGGGYSPYIKESWGGTGTEQDFDWDGIKNIWDEDADNDGVIDSFEYATRFNPFQPDIGIKKMETMWEDDDTIKIKVYSVQDVTGLETVVTLFQNNIIEDEQEFDDMVEFRFTVNPNTQYTFEVKVDGIESNYANKVNNIMSYTVPVGIIGVIGQWYYDLENQLQGIIRNNPLFYAANEFSFLENLFREGLAGIPLIVWIIIIVLVIVYLIYRIRKKDNKKSFFDRFRKREKKYPPGTTKIEIYK